ncbi:MAG: endonuclease [Planctomycetia bacterium]|nr:endonuclease [Planctomycetia bacterium]
MTPQEWEKMLRQSAQDRKLSGPERVALAARLVGMTEQQIAAFRAKAFEIIREVDFTPNQQAMLGWLEDVMKLLYPIRSTSQMAEALFTPDDDVCARLISLFDGVRQSVDVCVFTITDDRITNAILRAHHRGVQLRIITDNQKSLDLGADIVQMKEAGISVVMDHGEAHMHNKFAIFDRALLINGSYNWTRSAQSMNNENVVITNERRLLDRFTAHFEMLWSQFRRSN